jgi:hypothetical protein
MPARLCHVAGENHEIGKQGMSGFKPENFADRLKRSNAARVATVEKFQAVVQAPEDPEKLAERQAALAAREAKTAERDAARRAKLAEAAAAKQAKAEAARLAKESEALRSVDDAAARKAARDARYAARKARK